MKRIAEVLGVSRSNLADRHNRGTRPRGAYRKADDEDLLPLIRREFPFVTIDRSIAGFFDRWSIRRNG